MAKKDAKNREAAKAAAQAHTQPKAPKVVAAKQSSPKRGEEKHQKKSKGFFGKLFSFIWSIVFYLTVAAVTSSTIAIGLDCKGYGTPIPGSAPLCKDLSLLGSGKRPSAQFGTNVRTVYGQVFHGYHEQIKPHVAPLQKKASSQWKQFAKTDIGGKVEKIAYQVHTWIVEKFVKVQRFVKQQIDAISAWWKKEGQKTFGPYLEGFVVGLKIVAQVVMDVVANIISFVSHLALRAKTFVVAWTEGGFNAAMNTLNR